MRARFLAEAMGPDWPSGDECRPDWEWFGLLWDWAQKQEWWSDLVETNLIGVCDAGEAIVPIHFIHPDRFADALYEFLKERT